MKTTTRMLVCLGLLAAVPRAEAQDPVASPVFVAISVPDLEAAIGWYRDTLDLNVNRLPGSDQAKVAILSGDGLMVEIIEHAEAFDLESRVPEAERRFLVHGLFKVGWFVEDLDATVARLRERDARFRGDAMTDRANGVRTILLLDNNDNIIQLFERIE